MKNRKNKINQPLTKEDLEQEVFQTFEAMVIAQYNCTCHVCPCRKAQASFDEAVRQLGQFIIGEKSAERKEQPK